MISHDHGQMHRSSDMLGQASHRGAEASGLENGETEGESFPLHQMAPHRNQDR